MASEDAAMWREVFFSKSGSSTGKPFSSNNCAQSGESQAFVPNFWPYLPPFGPKVALWRAVLPFSSLESKSIYLQANKNSTISLLPKKQAFDKGHLPSLDFLFMSAPFS